MFKAGFILPSSEYLHDPFRGDPFSQLHLLTLLESHYNGKIDTKLIDLRGIKKNFAIQHIPECDLYLHSVFTLDYNEQCFLTKELHNLYPSAKHVAGGPHVNLFREECLQTFDSLVLGEGEDSIIKVVEDIKNSNLIKIYEQTRDIDINKYPFMKRHFLPKSAVAKKGLVKLKKDPNFDAIGTTVLFSRGCPYTCSFCAIPQMRQYGPGIRFRDPSLVKEEINYLKSEYSIETINILDEIGVPLKREQAVSHLEAIASTGILWKGQCRVDGITSELAKLIKKSGCLSMGMGVESVSQPSLDIIRKKINPEKAKQAIKTLENDGIETRIYMILGLPGEPEDIVEKSWQFIQETNPASVYLSILTVRPGTELFNNPEKFGIKKDSISKNWDEGMHMFGRYEKELPTLTFEYENKTPFGKGLSQERLVNNYLELQDRILKNGFGPI